MKLRLLIALLCGVGGAFPGLATALSLRGTVSDTHGVPVPHVRVRISAEHAVPYSLTVFTGADGTFRLHSTSHEIAHSSIDVFRIGWQEQARELDNDNGDFVLTVTLQARANVADQVPASAWLKGDRDSVAYRMTTLHCSNCHQLGAQRVRRFAESLREVAVSARAEAWLERAAEDLGSNVGAAPVISDANPEHGRVCGLGKHGAVHALGHATSRRG